MTTSATLGQHCIDAAWRLRRRLGRRGRTWIRRSVDPVLSPLIGSVRAVSTDAPLVALTIDDGPDAHWTEPVLRVLADAGAHATFFMLVERAEAHPDLVHRVVDAGHEIGLHGIDHTALPRCPHPIEGVLAEGMARLESVSGRRPVWFRPPFGSQTLGSYQATRRVGLDVVVWGAQGADWELSDPGEIAARVAGVAHAGDIVLLHDGLSPEPPPGHPVATLDRAAAVAATVSRLATAGLGCTSLGDLVASGRPRRSVWFRPPSD